MDTTVSGRILGLTPPFQLSAVISCWIVRSADKLIGVRLQSNVGCRRRRRLSLLSADTEW